MKKRGRKLEDHGTASRPRDARRGHSRSRAQSLTELALALPVLLLLMLGTIDLGRAYFDYIQMRNGAFEGARYGSINPTDTSGIVNAVMNHGVPSDTKVTVSLAGAYTTIGGEATVTVNASRTFTPVSVAFLQKYFGIGAFKLSVSATMQVMT